MNTMGKTKNKKAWLRIVEAFIAVLIVTSLLLIIVARKPKENKAETIHEMQRVILEQISSNESLREYVLNENKNELENFIKNIAPPYWNFSIRICEIESICGILSAPPEGKEIYVDEILISSTLHTLEPKKLKFFVWEK